MQYALIHAAPTIEEYRSLRQKAGLAPREYEAAKVGLRNSLFSVVVKEGDKMIGMGRIVGDGGCHVQITDIAVDPSYQGMGIGKAIMKEIMTHIRDAVPKSCFVNLFADVDFLYQRYGFTDTKSKGMYLDWSKL